MQSPLHGHQAAKPSNSRRSTCLQETLKCIAARAKRSVTRGAGRPAIQGGTRCQPAQRSKGEERVQHTRWRPQAKEIVPEAWRAFQERWVLGSWGMCLSGRGGIRGEGSVGTKTSVEIKRGAWLGARHWAATCAEHPTNSCCSECHSHAACAGQAGPSTAAGKKSKTAWRRQSSSAAAVGSLQAACAWRRLRCAPGGTLVPILRRMGCRCSCRSRVCTQLDGRLSVAARQGWPSAQQCRGWAARRHGIQWWEVEGRRLSTKNSPPSMICLGGCPSSITPHHTCGNVGAGGWVRGKGQGAG